MSLENIRLNVPHYDTETEEWIPKMVGKSLDGRWIHEEIRRSQRHNLYDTFGGVDTVVAYWLVEHGYPVIIHQNVDGAWRISPAALIRDGARHFWDYRDRLFLEQDRWQPISRVSTKTWVSMQLTLNWRMIAEPPAVIPTMEDFIAAARPRAARTVSAVSPSTQATTDIKNPCPCCEQERLGPNGEWDGGCSCRLDANRRFCKTHYRKYGPA